MNLLEQFVGAFYWTEQSLAQGLKGTAWPSKNRAQALTCLAIADDEESAPAIARRIGVTRQRVHQLLTELQQQDLIELIPNAKDKRMLVIRFTSAGKELKKQAEEVMLRCEHELGKRIGPDLLRQMKQALAQDWGQPVDSEET